MRRLGLGGLLVAAVAVLAVAGAGAAPRLQVLDREPLVVRGTGFGAGERVVATASTLAGPHVVRTRANARGAVVVRFAGLPVDPCAGAFAVRLRGASGAAVAAKLAPWGACPQLDP